jgi:hypothetical protein
MPITLIKRLLRVRARSTTFLSSTVLSFMWGFERFPTLVISSHLFSMNQIQNSLFCLPFHFFLFFYSNILLLFFLLHLHSGADITVNLSTEIFRYLTRELDTEGMFYSWLLTRLFIFGFQSMMRSFCVHLSILWIMECVMYNVTKNSWQILWLKESSLPSPFHYAQQLITSQLIWYDIFVIILLGRYLLFNAIVNQLRYPNNHTHYFSRLILFLFAEARQEIVQEQITRFVLQEKKERTKEKRPPQLWNDLFLGFWFAEC